MINIYASSVAKSVFVWICIILLLIAWYFSIYGALIIGNEDMVKEVPLIGPYLSKGINTAINFIPHGKLFKIVLGFAKYGGIIAFTFLMSLLMIYESAWRPYKHIKGKDKQINELIEKTELKRLKNKYE